METPNVDRLKVLEAIASIAADTLRSIDDWLGQASTREAAMDAIWRLRRALQTAGFDDPIHHDLDWRGCMLRAMESADIGCGEDDEIRLRLYGDRSWMSATGPRVRDLLRSAEISDETWEVPCADPICPRCRCERLWIEIQSTVRLTVTAAAEKTSLQVATAEAVGEPTWPRESIAWCPACGWKGLVQEVLVLLGSREQ
jgi:hypothetical protein